MKTVKLKLKTIQNFKEYLYEQERSAATIEKYIRDIRSLYNFLSEDKIITKSVLIEYKNNLNEKYKVSSINSMLAAINSFLDFIDLKEFKLKQYKVQKRIYCDEEKELTKEEYKRLLDTASKSNNQRLYMLLQTICGTGIRVSEHKFIIVESLKDGKVTINNKGKIRDIFITKRLRKLLKKYCKDNNIKTGSIFVTRNGKPLDRSNIWKDMQKLCAEADVDSNKVFPHNLRHLFALSYYRLQKDIVRLADILGHSSVETTRIYTMTSWKECQESISQLDLVEMLS